MVFSTKKRKGTVPKLKRIGVMTDGNDLGLGCLVGLAKEVDVLIGIAKWTISEPYMIEGLEGKQVVTVDDEE